MKRDVLSVRLHDHTHVAGPAGIVSLKPTLDRKGYPGMKLSWDSSELVIRGTLDGFEFIIPLSNCENFVLTEPVKTELALADKVKKSA